MRKLIATCLLGSAALTMSPAMADQYEDAIEYRQATFTMIKWNFGQMGAMVKGAKPFDQKKFESLAENLSFLSDKAWEGFSDGSDLGDTKAKSAVWDEPEKFKKEQQKFETEVMALVTAVKSADEKAIKAQFGKTGKSCKSCHKAFKEKND